MKNIETVQRDWLIVLIILPMGILLMLLVGQMAIRLSPEWRYDADMRSYLDPDSGYLTPQGNIPVAPILADILTPPSWRDVFLTPNATFPTQPSAPTPRPTYTPSPSPTEIPATPTITPSPTRTIRYPTLTFTPTVTPTGFVPTPSYTPTATPTRYTLTINIVGNGKVNKNPNQATYLAGTNVQLIATPDPGWMFAGWSGDLGGSANPTFILMNGNKTVTATFTQIEYTLTINIIGSGIVIRNPNQATYHYGDAVQLTANPSAGWMFDRWAGDLNGSANPTTITVNGNKSVTATFIQLQYTLTINIVGNGTVTRNPSQATYPAGTSVLLTANANTGWTYTGWSGDLSGSTNPDTITMDSDKTVTATFTAIEYTLTINIVGNGTVTRNPDKATYHYGDVVQLTANADPGWNFDSWSGDLSSSTNPDTITINGNQTVTATFILDPNEPDIGQPDGNLRELTDGESLVIDLGTNTIDVTAARDAEYDLVYYEFAATATEVYLDWIILQISTDNNSWYTIFYWGDGVADTHSNVGAYTENDNEPIPLSALYGTLPLKTGIAINVDAAPGVAVPPVLTNTIPGPVPIGSYRYIRIYAPSGGDADGAHVDSIDVLP